MPSYAFSSRPVILRIRSCTLIAVVILGIVWIGLLCTDAYFRGSRTTKELVAVTTLLAVNAISSISIPILVLLDTSDTKEGSRWFNYIRFELAFMCVHLVLQATAALLFTIFSQSFRCNNPNADIEGECRLMDMYVSIASWFTPIILLSFIVYLSVVSLRTAKRFPALWRTPVRFCPWDAEQTSWDAKATDEDEQPSIHPRLRNLEGGNQTFISSVSSSQPSSGRSSQSFAFVGDSQVTPPQRTYQSPLLSQAAFGVTVLHPPSLRVASQLPPWRVPSQPLSNHPKSRPLPSPGASHPPPNRVISSNTSARMSHVSVTKVVPSRPLPLRPGTTPAIQTVNPHGLSSGRVRSTMPIALMGKSNVDRYPAEWKRDRRDLTMHPSWLGRS